MYERSLLVLRALTDPRSGASVAGAPAGWAYVWPRDAGTAAIAFAAAGYRPEARRVARFLLGLDLDAAARFRGTGEPVPGRDAQGDAAGWVRAAAWAAGLAPGGPSRTPSSSAHTKARGSEPRPGPESWTDRADFQEKSSGDYLGNAIAAGVEATRIRAEFGTPRGLVRVADDPGSGLDPTAAWAVRPFPSPALYPEARRTLLHLAAGSGRFGILPSENWDGGEDPWTAPTAWTAWGLAALSREAAARGDRAVAGVDRRAALHLMTTLRRAATPAGLLPERVDAHTGLPTSTTPLGWSHAFAILAIRELWPAGPRAAGRLSPNPPGPARPSASQAESGGRFPLTQVVVRSLIARRHPASSASAPAPPPCAAAR